jgi:AcrR family transcriptional regulator
MPRERITKLTPEDWIKCAFRALSREGETALKAEVLARKLKTTKGSFYWHFKDMPHFRKKMLDLWQAQATGAIITLVEQENRGGQERLSLLAEIVSAMNADNEYGGLKAEPAIRAWAQHDRLAAKAHKAVDSARIDFVTGLFLAAGNSADRAREKAEIFYAGFVGLQTLAATQKLDVGARLQAILGLLISTGV